MSLKSGNLLFEKGLYDEAISEYKKIERSSPLFRHAVHNIALAKARLGKVKQGDARAVSEVGGMDDPLISIIMPVFNVGPYLDASIISVLSQTYRNLELIIVDDASTDNGKNIIEMYARLDPRIKAVHLDHNTLGGAGIPSNVGLKLAKGTYIGFVDSDDWVTADAFCTLVALAECHNADLVIGDFCTFDEETQHSTAAYDRKSWGALPRNAVISAADHPVLLRLSPVPWRKLYRRAFLEAHGIRYPEGDYFYEDNPLHWHALTKAARVVMTDCVVAHHRMSREGQTMSSSTYKLAAMCRHLNRIGNYLEKIDVAHKQRLIDEFFDYCYRSTWVADKQEKVTVKAIIEKQLANIVRKHRGIHPSGSFRDTFETKFSKYESAYPDVDLTVIIPTSNPTM